MDQLVVFREGRRLFPARRVAKAKTNARLACHQEVGIRIANEHAAFGVKAELVTELMHCRWVGFAGLIFRAPNPLHVGLQLMAP